AATPEYERIAALEPHHAATGTRGGEQPPVDLVLADACLATPLADEHLLGAAPSAIEHPRSHQLVVEHDIGISQRMERTQGQKIGTARARTDQKHRFGFAIDAALARAIAVDRGDKLRLRFVGTPGQRRLGNGACDDVLPEMAWRQYARRGCESAAMATDQFG